MTHGRGNWRMEWVGSTLHTTSEHGVSSITTADAHTSAASSRLNRRFKWTRPVFRKTKSDFCACAITFQLTSTCDSCFALPEYFFAKFMHCLSYFFCSYVNNVANFRLPSDPCLVLSVYHIKTSNRVEKP